MTHAPVLEPGGGLPALVTGGHPSASALRPSMKSSVWKSPPNCSSSLANAAASDSSIERCADCSVVSWRAALTVSSIRHMLAT
jgi:hypothetical protein